MLPQRIYRIFLRYAECSLALEGRGAELRDADGQWLGQVEALTLHRNRLVIRGRTSASRIGLRRDSRNHWTRPAASAGEAGPRDFLLDLPFEPGPFSLLTARGEDEIAHAFEGFSPVRMALARWALTGPFLWTLLRQSPQIWRWKHGGDLGAREVVKQALGLMPYTHAAELDAVVLRPAAPAPCPFDAVNVVMPVHNAFDLTRRALDRLERHTDLNWRLVLIEDASTEPGLRDWLRDWAEAPGRAARVRLLCQDRNRGFVASVNRGFAALRDWAEGPPGFPEAAPVVLLNTDAMLPAGWARRLLAPLADPGVASVTPLSNDAEIFTVPVLCARQVLAPGQADALDVAAARLAPGSEPVSAPTGVGFCMALSPHYLAQVPAFDMAFGRGYGEEADWCQKARRCGGRHVCATDLFVEHLGGASFGSAAKQQLLARSSAELARRYPRYDDEVQRFVRDDPLSTARLALGLSWAATGTQEAVPVYLAHGLGGGAEHDLAARIAGDIARTGAALVVRVGLRRRWRLELHCAAGVTAGDTEDETLLRQLVARLPRRRIIYSCGVGDRDPVALPGLLLALAGQGPAALPGGAQPLEFLLHDFFPISPSYTLLGADGVYRGLPRPGTPAGADPAHGCRRSDGTWVELAQWQTAWGVALRAAARIVVFSRSSRDLLREAYPDSGPVKVIPHPLRNEVPRIAPAAKSGLPVIGVLGNIGPHKGGAVVQSLSRDLARSGAARLVVIGQIAPEFSVAPPSRVHGSYRIEDLPGLVARYGIAGWLIPSIWPETFSFTTHEALATGMPVFCFDLGAQAEALRDAQARGAGGAVLPGAGRLDPAAILAHFAAPHGRSETDLARGHG